MHLDPSLVDILACPRCRSPLRTEGAAKTRETAQAAEDTEAAAELACTNPECGLVYPVRDGIPVLLEDEARSAPGAGA